MRKSAWLGLLVGCGVALSVWFGLRAEREEQARALAERSLKLLHAPLTEAASYRDLRAREAREMLEEAQALAASDARALLLIEARSVEALGRGEYARAASVLAQQRQVPQLGVISAAVALARGQASTAQITLDGLPTGLAQQPRALLLRSDVARALGRGDLALSAAQSGIDRHPQTAAFYERRGLAQELLGERDQAIKDLEHATQLDRRGTSALLALGRLQRGAGALGAAIMAFHEVQQRNPNEPEAWLGGGVCRMAVGDYASARSELERASELQPKRSEPLIALADLDMAEKDIKMALRRYRAALLLDPQNALGHLKFGNALMRSGTVPQAIAHYQAAITARPDLAAAHNGLGAAFTAQGDLVHAEGELQAAAKLDPADAHPWLNLARVYEKRGDVTAEAAAIAQARERNPELALATFQTPSAPRDKARP